VNGQGAATSTGFFPPQAVPTECGSMARTMLQRASAASAEVDVCLGNIPATLWREERGQTARSPAPEDQVNHIPVRPSPAVAPRGDARCGLTESGRQRSGRTDPSVNL
jgi:hypothetical protein